MTARPAQSPPNEMLYMIFEYLHGPAHSAVRSSRTPKFKLTTCSDTAIKPVSCVCRSWRSAVLPALFCYARLLLQYEIHSPRPKMHVELQPFLDFILQENLVWTVDSFVLGISDGAE